MNASKTLSIITLGITKQQLLAALMLGSLLLPITAPVAALGAPTNGSSDTSATESLSLWDDTITSLNNDIEALTTPWRPENASADIKDDLKTADSKPKTVDEKLAAAKPLAPAIKSTSGPEQHKSVTESQGNYAPTEKPVAPAAPMFFDLLPAGEHEHLYDYTNNLGSPRGQVEADSANRAAAIPIRHRAGIANFSFDVPLASMPGRGLDAAVGMTYNSRTWAKTPDGTGDHYTYDVEESWIAPGFSAGFGYLESQVQPVYSGATFLFNKTAPIGQTESDGTRREMTCSSWSGSICNEYRSSDGSQVRFSGDWTGNDANFTATYPNGMKVFYASTAATGSIKRHYPVILEDRNGNRVRITYVPGLSGRIASLTDTLNRQIKFYYDNDISGNPDKLVAVTIPGLAASSEMQTVRFYYDTLTLSSSGRFAGTITAPSTIRVLSYVYMPATDTGYKYEYDTNYGMIKKINRYVGMTASSTGLTATGTISSDGTWAASTEYNYPDGTTALTDVPKYTKRTDDWAGRTGNAQETLYESLDPSTATNNQYYSNITVKDNGFDVLTQSISDSNGFLKETSVWKVVGSTNTLMSKTNYTFNTTTRNLTRIAVTNDAGLIKATEFEYDAYSNQTKARECDYAAANTPCTDSSAIRRTETTYRNDAATSQGWLDLNLISLPKTVTTIVGGAVVSKTTLEYDHNGNDSTLVRRSDIDQITHDIFFNPEHPAWDEDICSPDVEAPPGGCPHYVHHYGYTSSSAYRGNVTKVTRYSDATITTDPNADVSEFEYDIAGNQVSATLSCCNLKTTSYGTTWSETGYAYPVSETKGSGTPQLMTSYGYNLNTGQLIWSKDPSLQDTTLRTDYEYESDTLRPKTTTYPNGGVVETFYSDKEQTGTNLLPGYVRQTTTLDSSHTAQSYSYFDARGLGLRSALQTTDGWLISAAEYDNLGRIKKSYNPYYGSTPVVAIPTGTKYTEVTGLDSLGRTTEVTSQDATTVHTYPDESTVTYTAPNSQSITGISTRVMDQAGKERRQIVDALGRIVRVDEPTAGGLGAVATPNQPTYYEYDGNDNLTKVIQSDGTTTQNRLFKYDSLSRLVAEKQVEANATLNDAGTKVTSGGLWTKVLKYSSQGLLTDGYDARGVHTQMAYDGLNRVSGVTYSGETGYQTPAVTYTYDQSRSGFLNVAALTRVETAASGDTPATATEFDYDAMGRVSKHRQWIGTQEYDLEYGYNLAGQLTTEKYPSGRVVTNSYDANGRLSSIADANRPYLSSLAYQGNGGSLSSMTYGNGTVQTLGLNDRMQMTSQELKRGSETLQKYQYGYGQLNGSGVLDPTKNNGQLSTIESYVGTAKQWTKKFSYDQLGRLSQEQELRGDNDAQVYKNVYDFDRFGNMYRKTANNTGALGFTPIEDSNIDRTTNRLMATSTGGEEGGIGGVSDATMYDEAGNVITDNKFRGLAYTYDANGRMVGSSEAPQPPALPVMNPNGDPLSVYDAAGMRVAERIDGVWTFMVYDIAGKLVADYGGVPSADEGGVRYVLSDWQGSTRAALSNAGYVQARMDYSAYGEDIGSGTGMRTASQGFGISTDLRQKYGLTERDSSTGLDHAWFRKNENRAGRWTSPDPYGGSVSIGNPQSFNRFSYAGGEPTNFVDPTGLLLAIPIYHCERVIRGDSVFYVCTVEGYWIVDDNPSGGYGPPGTHEPGMGVQTVERPPNKKKKRCKQHNDGRDATAINGMIRTAGLPGIENLRPSQYSPEGEVGDTRNREALLAAIRNNLAFIYDTGMGGLHAKDVGDDNIDSRSRLWSGPPTLGRDSDGMEGSLQVTVGQTDPATGRARVYVDRDCINPAEGPLPAAIHGVQIFINRLGKLF